MTGDPGMCKMAEIRIVGVNPDKEAGRNFPSSEHPPGGKGVYQTDIFPEGEPVCPQEGHSDLRQQQPVGHSGKDAGGGQLQTCSEREDPYHEFCQEKPENCFEKQPFLPARPLRDSFKPV